MVKTRKTTEPIIPTTQKKSLARVPSLQQRFSDAPYPSSFVTKHMSNLMCATQLQAERAMKYPLGFGTKVCDVHIKNNMLL